MSKDYSEDQLIQKSAADLLENEQGWKSVMTWDAEVLGETGTLGRKSYSDESINYYKDAVYNYVSQRYASMASQ